MRSSAELIHSVNRNRRFSGWNDLPRGNASDKITPGCMVLEGGAFRGLYGEGVLDALMQEDINLECTVGVSAGAMNGMNYVSGQIGRSARVNLGHRHDRRYVGLSAMPANHGIIGFDYVFGDYEKEDPFNGKRFFRGKQRFTAVATNVRTGAPAYFEKDDHPEIILRAIQASASMPYVSRPVAIGGQGYLDGGCSVNIPYRWALDQGFDRIVVIRTRPVDFRKSHSDRETVMARRFYRSYPELARDLLMSHSRYNEECRQLIDLQKAGRIFTIAPSGPVKVSRLEGDMEKLGALYYMGYEDGKKALPALRKYLDIA